MKKNKEKNELVGGGLPLATANLPTASGSSATPTSGGHPRNAPGEKELQTLRLDEICESIVDCPHSTPKWTEFGLTVLRSHNIRGGKLDLTERSYTDKKHFDERNRRARPQLDDLVITREAPMGEVCIIPDGLECCLGQRMVLLRPNQERVFPKYLLYAIQGDEVQHQISWSEGTGSTVSNLRIPHLQALKIPLPPLPIQKRIASILGALDDKIALNRRINQTLEQMAQALFQSWFVDFDPVKAKQAVLEAGGSAKNAELAAMQAISGKSATELKTFKKCQPEQYAELEATAKLFPSKLVESELGLIPEGWEVKSLGSLTTLITKGTTPTSSDIQGAKDLANIPYIKVKDISSDGFVTRNTLEFIPESVHLGILKRSIVFENDILFSIAGSIGRIAVVDADLANSNTNQAVGIIRLQNKENHMSWVLLSLKSKRIQNDIASKVVQGVQANASLTNLRDIQLIQSNEEVLCAWNRKTDSLMDSIYTNQVEERSLIESRDTLLPKLLSGELDISKVLMEER